MEEAYHRACMAHPEVSKQVTQRNVQQSAPRVGDKKRAASSVRTGHGANPEPKSIDDMDLRDMLEKQMPGGDVRI